MTTISSIWKQLTSILSNLNNFHSLEVMDRVSETQLQVGENSNWIIWRLKGQLKKQIIQYDKHINAFQQTLFLTLSRRIIAFKGFQDRNCNIYMTVGSPTAESLPANTRHLANVVLLLTLKQHWLSAARILPHLDKTVMMSQHWVNAGPTSETLARINQRFYYSITSVSWS